MQNCLRAVFKGSKIILHLEEGRKVEIGNGDIVGKSDQYSQVIMQFLRLTLSLCISVQRGTIHAWENPTNEYARMYFILQAAKPFLVDGVCAAAEEAYVHI